MKALYITFIALVIWSCGNSEKEKPVIVDTQEHNDQIILTKTQFEGENIQLGSIAEYDFTETVVVNGMIDVPPHNKSRVTTFMGGYITKTPLLVGDKVKKGQLLVTMENTEYVALQQQFLEVAEQLKYLKNEFTRQKTLFDEQITSEKNYLKAESTYKSSLAQYNGIKKKLQMLNINPNTVLNGDFTSTINIYATISGSVTSVNVSNGSYVGGSDVIMEIVDIDHIHLELSVFEKDIMKIKKGQKITFKIPEASDKTYTAHVHLVGTIIDETSRRVQVHGHIDNDDENFIVGMFVEAAIHINDIKSMGLPKEAIVKSGNHNFIFVLNNKTSENYVFRKTEVETGMESEDFIEILNPEKLKSKNLIITGTNMFFSDSEGGQAH